MHPVNRVVDSLKFCMGDKEFLCRINIFKHTVVVGKNKT